MPAKTTALQKIKNPYDELLTPLRGIDCPEINTNEEKAAKIFVQSYIKEADQILVRSFRDDKYGRYLADIFLLSPAFLKRGLEGVKDCIYLNNLLLQNGHVVRM